MANVRNLRGRTVLCSVLIFSSERPLNGVPVGIDLLEALRREAGVIFGDALSSESEDARVGVLGIS
jgi:hypothetical protein